MEALSTPSGTRGPTVVITGASAGIGHACAHHFARNGARIGLIARDPQALDEVKVEVENLGAMAFAHQPTWQMPGPCLQRRRLSRTLSDRSRFGSTMRW
jgi:NAD(P)-dependent dehydrogenase (short-subunit alcohol dehydrogenase family)